MPPTNARRGVVAFGASLAFLSFLDRAAISQTAPAIARDLGLTPVQMGLVFSAFGITYAAFEIPSGRLCDKFGARLLLTRVVILWSILTAATGAVLGFTSLVVTRLLFGIGESGCFPGIARVFRTWLPPDERNIAEGVKAASARVGAAITPALIASLSMFLSWREIFYVFGAVGIVWAYFFRRWYRDNPREHSSVNDAERALLPQPGPAAHGPVAWGKLLRSGSLWLLGAQWFCHYYGFYFYITWLPTYLYQARGLDLRRGSLAAGLPLITAALGSLVAGWAAARLTRRLQSAERARRWLGYAAYIGAGALLLLFTALKDPTVALAAMSLSSFAAEFSGPITWTTSMDMGGENVGAVSGFMNMLGHFGGSVAPTVTGYLLLATGNSWTLVFYVSAAIYAAGALCWAFIDSTTPLDLKKGRPNELSERPLARKATLQE
jgi:MFS transporter, ACS family, glucarate transporter